MLPKSKIRIRADALFLAFGLASLLAPSTTWIKVLLGSIAVICLVVGIFPSLAVWTERLWTKHRWARQLRMANLAAYRTVGITAIAVDIAMKEWGRYVVSGKATPDEESQVRAAFQRYQDTARTLRVILETWNEDPTPPELAAAAIGILSLLYSAGLIITNVARPLSPDATPRREP